MKRMLVIVLLISLFIVASSKEASAGQAWAVIDADTGRLLEGSNENVRLPIASLTKMWTAFTVLESGVSLDTTTISPAAASAEGSSIYLPQGHVADVEGLLYGLLLRSGNDAAYTLAEHTAGSMEGFVNLMNDQALHYGLKDTVFTNPSGLHDELHLSTAYETALMLHYALGNEKFRKISATLNYTYKTDEETRSWRNKHRLLHSEASAVAGKTGFTKAAGRTLATYFEKDGKNIIVVTLNDGDDWNTHKNLASKVFSSYKLVTIAKKGTYDILPGIEGELKSPIRLLLTKGEKENIAHVVTIPRGKNAWSAGQWTVLFNNKPLLTAKIDIMQ